MSSSHDARHKCDGVKALHVHRDAIKARLRQRHERREAQARHARMTALRDGNAHDTDKDDAATAATGVMPLPYLSSPPRQGMGEACYSGGSSDTPHMTCSPSHYSSYAAASVTTSPSSPSVAAAAHMLTSATTTTTDESWRDLGDEFGCDVDRPDVIEYLLALEEEIRQERLVALYEEANDARAWADYCDSLAH